MKLNLIKQINESIFNRPSDEPITEMQHEYFRDPDVNRAVDELARAIVGSDMVGDRSDFAGSDDAGDLAGDVGGAVLMAVEQRLKRLHGGTD